MNIVILERFYDSIAPVLEQLGHQVYKDTDEVTDNIEVYVGFADKEVNKDKYPSLKYIQLASAGFDGLDLELLKKQEIRVMNAKGIYSEEIAEYILAYVLSSYKMLPELQVNQENKIWSKKFEFISLKNKKVLYLGTGSIAQETAKRFASFGTENIGLNTKGGERDYFDFCYPLKDMYLYLNDADIIVCCLPENEDTIHLVDATFMQRLKEGSIFINVGRGSLVDEKSIKDSIAHLRSIVLDVFESEPLSQESYLWETENVVVTPHSSGISSNNIIKITELVVKNIERIQSNKELFNQII